MYRICFEICLILLKCFFLQDTPWLHPSHHQAAEANHRLHRCQCLCLNHHDLRAEEEADTAHRQVEEEPEAEADTAHHRHHQVEEDLTEHLRHRTEIFHPQLSLHQCDDDASSDTEPDSCERPCERPELCSSVLVINFFQENELLIIQCVVLYRRADQRRVKWHQKRNSTQPSRIAPSEALFGLRTHQRTSRSMGDVHLQSRRSSVARIF